MTKVEIEEHKQQINRMTPMELAHWVRFAPAGHPYFSNHELYEHFRSKFHGMTPQISKAIGY